MPLSFHPLTEGEARDILDWHYPSPYDIYDAPPDRAQASLRSLLDPANAYFGISNMQGELQAFCCFGPDARVPGGDYSTEALDVGLGLRPDLAGQGRGSEFVQALLDFASGEFLPAAFRVTVAQFNERALRVWEKAGFVRCRAFRRDRDGLAFALLVKDSEAQSSCGSACSGDTSGELGCRRAAR